MKDHHSDKHGYLQTEVTMSARASRVIHRSMNSVQNSRQFKIEESEVHDKERLSMDM